MLMADAAGGIIAVNGAFCGLTGIRAEDVVGRRLESSFFEGHWSEFLAGLHEAIADLAEVQGQIRERRNDGSSFSAWMSISPVRNGSGGVAYYLGTLFALDGGALAGVADHRRPVADDALTGLASRGRLQERLEHTIADASCSGERLAVLFLDLDRFKNINDSLGHAVGDEVLRGIAERLRRCVRTDDMLARVGGDEFALVLRGIVDAQVPVTMAKQICQQIYRPFVFEGRELNLTASLGISLYPQDGTTAQSLIEHANTAMYRAKERGSNSYAFYRPKMTTRVQERLLIEQSLHRALERNEFVVYYQPQIEIASGRVTGGEALVRWDHPELGHVGPDRFIALAEEIRMIRSIGSWVMRTVCGQMDTWRAAGLSPLRMAVNLSAQQILRSRHTDSLRAVLDECWVPVDGMELEIEITESSLQTSENALATAKLLKSLGITLAIDDFGTGYSSLMALKLLPIDRIKIDRSFVAGTPGNTDHAAVTAAVIAMGKALGLRVLAEGVETPEQLAFLRAHGCDEAQGYLFSKPLPAAEFQRFIEHARNPAE